MAVYANALGDAGVILTTNPLGASASYIQPGVDRLRQIPLVGRVRGLVFSDKSGTLYLEESEDKSTWTTTATVNVSANTTTQLSWTELTKRYFRFRYVNGSTAQTNFVLVQQYGGLNVSNVQLTGSYATIDSNPVVSRKTVSTTAAEIFAGVSRLANRYAMIVYNESSVPVYWGPPGVTTSTGFPLLPQDSIVFQFNPSAATAIYFIAASSAAVRVVELA